MQPRDQMIEALKALGLDVSAITDAVPDQVIQAMLEFAQKCQGTAQAAPTANGGGANPNSPVPSMMADNSQNNPTPSNPIIDPNPKPDPSAMQVALQTDPRASHDTTPSQVVVKFNAQYPGLLTGLLGQVQSIAAKAQAVERMTTKQLEDAKAGVITTLFRECGVGDGGTAQITPAMQPPLRAMLMNLDHVAVRKFSDGKAAGTALEEECSRIKATFPRQANVTRVPQPGLSDNGRVGLTPERRALILSGSPLGQQVLKVEKAGAKK